MSHKNEEMLEFFRLVSIPTIERVERKLPDTLRAMSKHLKVGYPTIMKWHARAKAQGISKIESYEFEPATPPSREEQEKAIFMKNLTIDASKPGATAPTRALYAEIVGLTKKKLNITIGLSADEIAWRNLEAAKQLEEGGFN